MFFDSEFTHLAWINTPREAGGLGKMNIPILADRTHAISKKYGVLKVSMNSNLTKSYPAQFYGVRWY